MFVVFVVNLKQSKDIKKVVRRKNFYTMLYVEISLNITLNN